MHGFIIFLESPSQSQHQNFLKYRSVATLFIVLMLDLMMYFSSAAVEKDIIRWSTSTTKRVAQAIELLNNKDSDI